MKKIIDTVRAAVWQTDTKVFLLNRPLTAANNVAPKAPTAPASDGVAKPKRIEPLINVMRKTGGKKLLRTSGNISPLGIFNKFAGKGSDKIGQDELLIAMSRVSDNIQLGDVKELHRIVVGAPTGNAIEDVKVPINEVV